MLGGQELGAWLGPPAGCACWACGRYAVWHWGFSSCPISPGIWWPNFIGYTGAYICCFGAGKAQQGRETALVNSSSNWLFGLAASIACLVEEGAALVGEWLAEVALLILWRWGQGSYLPAAICGGPDVYVSRCLDSRTVDVVQPQACVATRHWQESSICLTQKVVLGQWLAKSLDPAGTPLRYDASKVRLGRLSCHKLLRSPGKLFLVRTQSLFGSIAWEKRIHSSPMTPRRFGYIWLSEESAPGRAWVVKPLQPSMFLFIRSPGMKRLRRQQALPVEVELGVFHGYFRNQVKKVWAAHQWMRLQRVVTPSSPAHVICRICKGALLASLQVRAGNWCPKWYLVSYCICVS